MADTPSLESFGHGAITQLGHSAQGGRPLLVVLGEYTNFPAFDTVHPTEYYERLGFGDPVPPFTTDDPVNPASLREYFRENSNGRFWFDRVAVVGPIPLGEYANDPGPEARSAGILKRVAEVAPESFTAFDADQDGTIAFHELCVVLVENITGALPANRDNSPFTFTYQSPQGPAQLTVSVHVAGAGPLTPFFQIAHELSHSLGTIDLYNTGQGNHLLTLMGAYPFFGNDQGTVHLDIWHKLALGWVEPQRCSLAVDGSAVVREGADGSVLLWHESRQADEYFLVERRRGAAGDRRYDASFPDDGVLIWRVRQGLGASVAHLGAPDLALGGSGVWHAGQTTPELRWSNGEPTGSAISVADDGDGGLRITWGGIGKTRHLKLLYGGNGTTPVDSGLPLVGVFYGVTRDGNLEWNRYQGHGEPLGAMPGTQVWDGHTGNLIGRGWAAMRQVIGCGDGVIMAIHPNGNLHWYSYSGNGESDVTGALGWDLNSGNVIGNGWQNFRHVFVAPRAGRTTSRLQIFAVAENGDLHWYSYSGNGEHDPSGSLGWHPNSGHRVGNGWQSFRHIHGSGNVFFAVHENGNLLWYSYSGQGEEDPSGVRGWHRNSGNPIGQGWQGMRHVFGGVSDVGGFGHVVYGVDATGDLRWYRYSGQGEADVTGVQGWHPSSGTVIGANW
ncbi:tachylectin-related carbohydrate-binding protein [Micromonospora sp. NPDC048930]|uniref:tachylectin-related carbohydrate-binding protein n=1 Tax=Micromonospora sp. NPDC048930 TaxID=3364261 RepID=UPI0037209335